MACEFTDPQLVQCIRGKKDSERFENVAFSSSGQILGVVNAGADSVLLFRRKAGGLFEANPYCSIHGAISRLLYPHDLSFAMCDGTELLAVTQRRGAITFFAKDRVNDNFSPNPVFEISGSESKLHYSDGGAFVPPDNEYLAACNMEHGIISFFHRTSQSPIRFEAAPEFELQHANLRHPDGLGFSPCGRWLAVANHGSQSVIIFQRRDGKYSNGILEYDRQPVVTIDDAQLHYPHSVAFSPKTNHLLVANAGANYISVFEPAAHSGETRWSQMPKFVKKIASDETFRAFNSQNRMEGGPKGIAVYDNHMAVCSPEVGINIYSFHESHSEANVGV